MARTALRLLRRTVGAAVLLAALALATVMLLPAALGYERYVIVSGSMTGTVDTGSIAYAKPVPTSDLKVGDVITYAPPAGESPTELVTHRIHSVVLSPKGERVFRTKGDANAAVDPWTFALPGAEQATMRFHVPYVGYALAALSIREVRVAVIGAPAALIALLTLLALARDLRADRRTHRAPADVAAPVVTSA